jgi:outer membrane receptor protein involved in Fe transport
MGTADLAIRGITSGTGNPVVGVTFDDVPYGSSSTLGTLLIGGLSLPDPDPSDLKSIEVLRGPQGTLYGASSMGGLLKFTTVDPSTDSLSGRLEVGTGSVYDSGDIGYSFQGAVNVPVSDVLAIRASGFTRRMPGYVDNVQTGDRDVNRFDVTGGHLSALWRPTEDFSVKLGALFQEAKLRGSSDVQVAPGFGDLQQIVLIGTGWHERTTQAYSATLTGRVGSGELTGVSGYNIYTFDNSIHVPGLDAYYESVYGVPTGAPVDDQNETTKFTQELRYSVPLGQKVEWLMGAFYTHESSDNFQQFLAVDPTTGAFIAEAGTAVYPVTFTEYAAFTNFTFHLTERFDIQVGGRKSQNKQTYSEIDTGEVIFGVPLVITPEIRTKANAFTYLLTPSFKVSDDLMVYARLASGYRAGGPNGNCVLFDTPCQFDPDKTKNYELGVKGNILDHALSFDASLYYIDWKDLQISVLPPGALFIYTTNGGRAKSQGVELAVESRPLTGLTIGTSLAWNDAVLTEDFPGGATLHGLDGDRLPLSARFSGSLSLRQDFPIAGTSTGFVGGSVTYVGDRVSYFGATAERQTFPAYAQVDVRVGVERDAWTARIALTNVADKRGSLSGGLGSLNPAAFQYIQPRTVWLSVEKTF